jgi:hypothetical protein
MRDVIEDCQQSTGADFTHTDHDRGLSYYLPPYLIRLVIGRKDDSYVPSLIVESDSLALWRVIDKSAPAVPLAFGSQAECQRYVKDITSEFKRYQKQDKWPEIAKQCNNLSRRVSFICEKIDEIIARGYFKGRCSLCKEYASE